VSLTVTENDNTVTVGTSAATVTVNDLAAQVSSADDSTSVSVTEAVSTITISNAESVTVTQAVTIETVEVGIEGQQGAAGQGVPTGGTTGQILAKTSGTNYATGWTNASQPLSIVTYFGGL